MNWYNLEKKLCPKCGEKLKALLLEPAFSCSKCDFRISEQKFISILSNMYTPYNPDENLEDLNNLGHEKLLDGFLTEEENE